MALGVDTHIYLHESELKKPRAHQPARASFTQYMVALLSLNGSSILYTYKFSRGVIFAVFKDNL